MVDIADDCAVIRLASLPISRAVVIPSYLLVTRTRGSRKNHVTSRIRKGEETDGKSITIDPFTNRLARYNSVRTAPAIKM